jgi:DNA-binding CsgD family transcriptional regulator
MTQIVLYFSVLASLCALFFVFTEYQRASRAEAIPLFIAMALFLARVLLCPFAAIAAWVDLFTICPLGAAIPALTIAFFPARGGTRRLPLLCSAFFFALELILILLQKNELAGVAAGLNLALALLFVALRLLVALFGKAWGTPRAWLLLVPLWAIWLVTLAFFFFRVPSVAYLPVLSGFGAIWVCAWILGDRLSQTKKAPADAIPADAALSEREREVAQLLVRGKTYREIGKQLFIAPSTVKTHVLRIYEKMGVSNKIGLAHRLSSIPMEKNSPPAAE